MLLSTGIYSLHSETADVVGQQPNSEKPEVLPSTDVSTMVFDAIALAHAESNRPTGCANDALLRAVLLVETNTVFIAEEIIYRNYSPQW
jgi:hypothetical protein